MLVPAGWSQQLIDVGKLVIAYLLALPVGWYREREAHTIGVRTFPLVAVASCGYVLLGMPEYTHTAEGQSRIIQGLITGIGFIGGAAIFRARGSVRGTATAASIWNTGVVGAAVAEDRWLLAVTLALLNLFALRALLPIKQKLDSSQEPPREA